MDPTGVVGNRVGAAILDYFLGWVIFFVLAGAGSGGGEVGSTIAAWLVLLAFVAYWTILPGLTGWTVGKRLTGTRIVTEDGQVAGVGSNIIRFLGWIVDGFPYFIPGLTGFIVSLSSARHQRVGDMLAGTYVVRHEAVGRPILAVEAGTAGTVVPAGPPPPPPPPPQPANWYPDPRAEARLRYWDGTRWTEHTAE